MPKSLKQIDEGLRQFWKPELRITPVRVSRMMPRPRRLCTPMEAARVATVTVRERFNQQHFDRVIDARNYLEGE